jgi:hypothetical protein
MSSLAMNGIGSSFVTVSTIELGSNMIVKDWVFGTPSYPAEPTYQWQLLVNTPDPMVPAKPGNQYGDLTSLNTLPGQNTMPPSEKLFGSHYIVKIDPSLAPSGEGPYFDPSYGVWYLDNADFEAKAIDGYFKAIENDPPGQYHVRKKGGGVNISLAP